LYEEWFGLGMHDDGKGGVAGRNKAFGSKWRKHLDRQHYSRTSRIIQAIEMVMANNHCTWQHAVAEIEPLWKDSNRSLSKMVLKLQEKGYIAMKQKRGTKRKSCGEVEG
jgi:Transcriptional activator of glycolytic enzymes